MEKFSTERVGSGIHWRYMLYSTFFILHYSLAQAQTPTRQQLIGTWIGVHTEWDTDFFCALPTYIQLDNDSTYHLGMVDGSSAEFTSTWAMRGDTAVRLDTIHYAPRLVQVQNDLLRIGTNYPMTFRKFTPIEIDSVNAYQQLNGRVWQSDSLTISLYANGQASLENRATKQRTAYFWKLARFGSSVFLVIHGNQYNRDSGYKPLWQLSRVSAKQMQAIGWNGRMVATETFRFITNLSAGDLCIPSGFQTCKTCFQPIWYTTSLNHFEERYTLNQLIGKYYHPVIQAGQSGLVKIEFVVNCQGKSGLYMVSSFDDDYCPKIVDSRITNQLLTICRDHIATNPVLRASDEPGTGPQDIAVSLTFRFRDGQLIAILP